MAEKPERTTIMHSEKSALSGLTLRLLVCGIPTYTINPFAGLLVRWTTCSGEEWTVKRCKALKLTLIQLRAGSPTTEPLARNRCGGYKGTVGSLIRWALKSDENFHKVLAAFMAYSNWTARQVTSNQRKKFLESVNAPQVVIPESLKDALTSTVRVVVGKGYVHGRPQPLLTWKGSLNKRAPTLNGSVPQGSYILEELLLLRSSTLRAHVASLWDGIYASVFEGLSVPDLFGKEQTLVSQSRRDSQLVAGEVHFLQEPGYKLRSIASPYRLFQVASEPLKDELGKLVRSMPWDCTHGQDRAFPIIQEALKRKQKIHSIDLSNATDYFPFELQRIVLETIFGKDNPYVYLFADIASATWRSELGDIVWNRGQPLGFNPSFFTFTLTHGLLLRSLMGNRSYNHEFLVVGDDVVILDEQLALKYMSTLDLLGCPYSKDKTLISCELAEFAGKVVSKDTVTPMLKWRDVSDDNFLDLARLLGRRIRLLLSKKQQRVLDTFSGIPDFIHPYGLNWSYPGSNLESMIKTGLQLVFNERVLDSLTGLSTHINSQVYCDYGVDTQSLVKLIRKDWVEKTVLTFDEKVKSVFLQLGWSRRHDGEDWFSGLKDIPRALLPSPAQLPIEVKPPSRVTLLQRLSRFLAQRKKPNQGG